MELSDIFGEGSCWLCGDKLGDTFDLLRVDCVLLKVCPVYCVAGDE